MANSNSRTKNTLINISASFGGRIIKTILTFVVRTIFISTLGSVFLGINGIFTSILNMLSLAELGFSATIVYHLYKPLAIRDEHRIRVLLKFYKLAYRIIGFAIFFLGLCLIPALPYLIQDYDSISAVGVNAIIIFIIYLLQSSSSYLFFAYRQTVVEADQKKYIIDIIELGRTIIESILQIVSLIVLRSFVAYTLSTLISTLLFNFANAIIAQKLYPSFFIKEKDRLTKNEIMSLLKDCGSMFLYRVESVVLKATDNMVLSAFAGLETVGLYSTYLLILNACKGFLEKFYVSVKHSMGNLYAVEIVEKKFQFFEIMNYLTFILYGTTAVFIITCGDDLISVWAGNDYIIPQPFALLIGIELLLDGLIRNLTQIRNISGAFRQLWYRPVIAIVVNIVSSLILVRFLGINGVILGTLFAQLFVGMIVDPYVVMNVCFEKYKPLRYYYKKNVGFLVILTIGGIIDYTIFRFVLTGASWLIVILHAFIVFVSIPLFFVLIYKNKPEFQYLRRIIIQLTKKVFKAR